MNIQLDAEVSHPMNIQPDAEEAGCYERCLISSV